MSDVNVDTDILDDSEKAKVENPDMNSELMIRRRTLLK